MAEISARIQFARRIAQGDPALRLYAILDAESCARRGFDMLEIARSWRDAGVQLVQYRDKTASRDVIVDTALQLRRIFPVCPTTYLLLNDHPDLVRQCGFEGAHIGQTDSSPNQARSLIGPDALLGISTHSVDQALAASRADVDYVAIGPVFATQTKVNVEPSVGVCGVQAAAAVVRTPLVAIGGIQRTQAPAVLQAGANSVAVISALLPHEAGQDAALKQAQDFLAGLK